MRADMSWKSVFAMALLAVSTAATAGEPTLEYKCPERITTVQSLAQPMPDWRQSSERPFTTKNAELNGYSEHNLDNVSFSDGGPEDRGELIPDNDDELTGKVWVARWDLSTLDSIWLVCHYRQTTVTLWKEMPHGVKKCFVGVDKTKGIEVQRIWCNS